MIDIEKLKSLAEAVKALEDSEQEDELAEAKDALWLHMHCHTILDLISEIERLREDPRMRAIRSLRADCEQLKAENEALREDAGRYAHLKASWDEDVLLGHLDSNVHPKDWDRIIDADMSKQR